VADTARVAGLRLRLRVRLPLRLGGLPFVGHKPMIDPKQRVGAHYSMRHGAVHFARRRNGPSGRPTHLGAGPKTRSKSK
jgi:hypothetical protein